VERPFPVTRDDEHVASRFEEDDVGVNVVAGCLWSVMIHVDWLIRMLQDSLSAAAVHVGNVE
jgi:hypothetical protein